MKNLIFLFSSLLLVFSCVPVENNETATINDGQLSGTLNDKADETKMTRELMKAYAENNFRSIEYMISDDVECFFNSDQFDKEGWLSGVSSHFELFDNISNNKNQPINLTTANYNNGTVWSMAWFEWTGTGKYSKDEVSILVHHGFRWEDGKIVEAYHFFDPTALNNEISLAN